MDAKPLDEMYFRWLYSLVADSEVRDETRTYWKLFKQLYTTEFVWIVPNDDNRLEDGKALRREFLHAKSIDVVETGWLELGCSVLELMVGLARRLEFEAGGKPHYWFWVLMRNIGLRDHNDEGRYPRKRIESVLYGVMFRQYDHYGLGGFFPLNGPCDDQRKVELRYQMAYYVLERE